MNLASGVMAGIARLPPPTYDISHHLNGSSIMIYYPSFLDKSFTQLSSYHVISILLIWNYIDCIYIELANIRFH